MYFASRMQAGRMLASQIAEKHQGKECALIALGDGSVMVAAQIAMKLGCVLTMLLTGEVDLPRENVPIGGVTQGGTFTYNSAFSSGEIDEFVGEYRNVIEQQKMQQVHELNAWHANNLISHELLKNKNVILVSDGLDSPFALDLAAEYLKPVTVRKLIVATPLASVPAVDRIHILADEVYCLSVQPDYMDTDHYYELNDTPEHEKAVKMVEAIISHWQK